MHGDFCCFVCTDFVHFFFFFIRSPYAVPYSIGAIIYFWFNLKCSDVTSLCNGKKHTFFPVSSLRFCFISFWFCHIYIFFSSSAPPCKSKTIKLSQLVYGSVACNRAKNHVVERMIVCVSVLLLCM